MTTALLESPVDLVAAARAVEPRRGRPATLEERLDGAWRAIQAEGRTQCPVCGFAMRLEGGAGRCDGCRSSLS